MWASSWRSLFIYSFFIFGPLQELGNIINDVSASRRLAGERSRTFSTCSKEPRPREPVPVVDLRELAFRNVTFKHQSGSSRRSNGFRSPPIVATPSRSSVHRVPARRRW